MLITGCDAGIGYALAKHLHQLGFTVFAGCLHKVRCFGAQHSSCFLGQVGGGRSPGGTDIRFLLHEVTRVLPANRGIDQPTASFMSVLLK